ncbi:DUF1566 domain-containing protein [Leptospira congkakensis]|uniref:DUF1566 domain-containing protein n=1 Tax=Leptospira congkakensis TaxID=2484932 RepID=A0A4Z1AFQ3_9LEPT|nr:DUF1566 domain-containing protein [Leptospira congkakensis]TGL90208.1 DUF1566 domain-containing protein [Leptospira congkakensis]TGL91214.1 DUF1566 domain-containing protein [Leptospira congkakensis]TGL98266.1 DUF1566 domain-containing protein [Leptospira congkakensis]
MLSRTKRTICTFLVPFLSFFCQKSNFNNLCDPKSDDYLESLFLRYVNFDETAHCGVALKVEPPTFLICPPLIPRVNGTFFTEGFVSDGNRLSFSATPPLPEGISFSPFSNSLQGSYSGWKANRESYTITASNPKGSASCTYQPAWMGKLPLKTNLTTCYDAANNPAICSSVSGQDGNLQKGISQSFIGPTLVAGVEITTDLNTGLVWTSCQRGKNSIGCTPTGLTDFQFMAARTECASLNAGSGFAGRTDWRVPEIDEYVSTFDYSLANPSINQTYFPATDSYNYKTNTEITPGTAAFYPTFIESSIGTGSFSDNHRLRCVSNGTPPKNKRLQNNNDGTILDLDTSLVWQRCTAGLTNLTTCTGGAELTTNWSGAISYCQSLNLAGRTWRLPNANELRSLLDFYLTYGNPGVDPIYFPNTNVSLGPPSVHYWTSTTRLADPSEAFIVFFGYSSGGPIAKSNNADNRIRCVSDF